MLHPLIYPMFAMVLLTFVVALWMMYTRVTAISSGQMKFSYFKSYSGEATEMVLKTSRHFTNLFEVPVLFYATLLTIMILDISSSAILLLSWLFVVSRVLHAIIHIFVTNIYPRMGAYMLGWLAVLGLWGCILTT
jgi:hypothetical protein